MIDPSSVLSANIQMAMQQMSAQAQMQAQQSNTDQYANTYFANACRPGAPSPEVQRAAVLTLGEAAEAVIDRCYFWMEFAAVPVVSIAARWMLDKLADRLNAMADDMERRLPA